MTYDYRSYLTTEHGTLLIEATSKGIKEIRFIENDHVEPNENSISIAAKEQLEQYVNGQRQAFDLPLDAKGTEFQKQVWEALCSIPYGKTASYSDIAERLGKPKAVRAIGMANSKNPISIVVPCHRIIGKDGSLTGYAGGLSRKKWLLELEGTHKT